MLKSRTIDVSTFSCPGNRSRLWYTKAPAIRTKIGPQIAKVIGAGDNSFGKLGSTNVSLHDPDLPRSQTSEPTKNGVTRFKT